MQIKNITVSNLIAKKHRQRIIHANEYDVEFRFVGELPPVSEYVERDNGGTIMYRAVKDASGREICISFDCSGREICILIDCSGREICISRTIMVNHSKIKNTDFTL